MKNQEAIKKLEEVRIQIDKSLELLKEKDIPKLGYNIFDRGLDHLKTGFDHLLNTLNNI